MLVSGQKICGYARGVSNALFIYTGREVNRLFPELEEVFGKDNITMFSLAQFEQVESEEFFSEADPVGLIAGDMRDKLHFLANGRPLLLSLAVEWLARSIPLPDISNHSMEELKSLSKDELADLRARFEFELVNRIRRLRGLVDRAVLYMADINRRSERLLLAALLEQPEAG